MLAARAQAIKLLKQRHPFVEEGHLLSKLMAYCSKEAHSCVEKAAMISFVKLRILEPDSKCSLRGETLTKVIPPKFHSDDSFARYCLNLSTRELMSHFTIKINKLPLEYIK